MATLPLRPALGLFLAGTLAACEARTLESPGPSAEALPGAGARFRTAAPAQVRLLTRGDLLPLVTVGDTLPNGQPWAPIPDGLGGYAEQDHLVLYVNHELSASGVRDPSGTPRFRYARVSRLVLDPATFQVTDASYVVTGSEQYERLCSATWVGPEEGFPGGYFLTGEESTGGTHDGIQLAISRSGQVYELPWMGRYAHENQVAVPYAGKVVTLGLDDTRGASELYLYVADREADVLHGTGRLYVLTVPGVPNVAALTRGKPVEGRFVEVPQAASLSSGALQATVNALGAFPFVRLEDGDYDKQRGRRQPTLYFVDTGSGTTLCNGALCDPYGSIYRLELDPRDPTRARLTLLERSSGWQSGWASPDNVAASRTSLMVQEDPAIAAFARAPRIYHFRIRGNGTLGPGEAVVEANNPECVDAQGTCWETSGIVDASAWFGPGAWLFDVQAHSKPAPGANLQAEDGQLLFLRIRGT
ncbi:MAG TPA: alkaline phosphatase PhoX [Gemmatimonadales bacterium]|nr:alkaline phosphatase PhoX [Gemmatimonadales bacterium]